MWTRTLRGRYLEAVAETLPGPLTVLEELLLDVDGLFPQFAASGVLRRGTDARAEWACGWGLVLGDTDAGRWSLESIDAEALPSPSGTST